MIIFLSKCFSISAHFNHVYFYWILFLEITCNVNCCRILFLLQIFLFKKKYDCQKYFTQKNIYLVDTGIVALKKHITYSVCYANFVYSLSFAATHMFVIGV